MRSRRHPRPFNMTIRCRLLRTISRTSSDTTTRSPHENGALLGYVRELEAEQPKLISAEEPAAHAFARDSAIAALSAFVEQLQAREPGEPALQFAEAKEKAKPKAVKTKAPAKSGGDDEAMFVGSQVCLGCHTTQAAAFNQTVMGRIFRKGRNQGCPHSEDEKYGDRRVLHGERIDIVEAVRGRRSPHEADGNAGECSDHEAHDS